MNGKTNALALEFSRLRNAECCTIACYLSRLVRNRGA
jgi:hypothetical protein